MRPRTKAIHDRLVDLGEKLGFNVATEASNSVLSLQIDGAYEPRLDIMWSLPLTSAQSAALARVTGKTRHITHLPVVGIEVEGTTPSTKTLASDVANIAASGTRLGLLVVSEAGERNIYRRATRAVRTFRRAFGDVAVVPIEASWLKSLSSRSWTTEPARLVPPASRGAAGGETLSWSTATRETLRSLGESAGFIVAEPYTPNVLRVLFEEEVRLGGKRLRHMSDPTTRRIAAMTRSGDYFMQCQLDMAWLLPMPQALGDFLETILAKDPCARDHGLLYPELYQYIAVAGFELESSIGKHAGGGLLNLAAHSVMGIAVAPSRSLADELERVLLRYRPTLGLQNVFVSEIS